MSLREASRKEWSSREFKPTEGELRLGALQRIADATEKMAVNWQSLTTALERERESSARYRARAERLERRLRAQKAATTRAKRGKVPPLFGRWKKLVRKIDADLKRRR